MAWAIFAIIATVTVVDRTSVLASRPADDNFLKVVDDLLLGLAPVEFALLAALIVARQPRNVIGWLMMAPAFFFVTDTFVRSYLQQFPAAPATPTWPLLLVVWLNGAGWLLLIFPVLFTMLLFPDGRPLSPRWRWIVLAVLSMMVIFIFLVVFSQTLTLVDNSDWVVANPIGFIPTSESLSVLWAVALITMTLLSLAAPFIRFRRAAGVVRQQIKWLFYACGLFACAYVPAFFVPESDWVLNGAWTVLFGLAVMAIPAAIAVAILRYRLYDIDVIIRKTLIYGALTSLLALVYLGLVVTLQALFETITGQRSPVAIVISTLLIAALFAPLRRRVQSSIDRRFFRKKYNAEQVLAQFAETVRDEVDLEVLTAVLMQVVQDTMQPQSVTLWLKVGKRTRQPMSSTAILSGRTR